MKHPVRRSFKTRIFVTVLLVALLPLVACVGLMSPLMVQRSQRNLAVQAQQRLDRTAQALTAAGDTLRAALDTLAGSQALRAALERPQPRAVYRELFAATAKAQSFSTFGLYDGDGRCLYSVGSAAMEPLDPEWGVLRAARRGQEEMVWRMDDAGRLLAARALWEPGGSISGYLVFALTGPSFQTLFAGLEDTSDNALLLDDRWRLVYSSQQAHGENVAALLREELLSGQPLTAGGSEFLFYTQAVGGFTLVLEQPKVFTPAVMHSFYLVTGFAAGLCLLFCLWGAWMLSRHLSQPVHDLSLAMGQVERGNFSVHINDQREDELGRLSASFNHMAAEYQDYLKRSVQRQKELNDAQLRMMQAQLNPHFLYNTLDSVKWMAVSGGAPQIATLATDLADLLRAAISADEFISLEQELELVERYVDIQQVRFGDRFTCEIDVPGQFRACRVPKLVLQPIVENAIIHGVAQREDGYIKLYAQKQEGDLLVSVSDNGCGMPRELVEQLNQGQLHIDGGHLGLNNVNSILRLHYGSRYGISASASPGEGSRVCLRLPLQTGEAAPRPGKEDGDA